MDVVSNLGVLRTLGVLAVATGAALIGASLGASDSALARAHARYVAKLNASLRLLFLPESGAKVVVGQALAAGLLVTAQIMAHVPYLPVWMAAVVFGPKLYLARARQKRIALLELQVDGFVLSFANALKTVPSPAAALETVVTVLPQPTRQEIEHVLKEMRVGSTLDQALVAMSARLKSKPLDTAFSAVLIGLKVGGNLPLVLERTAGAIREMGRLHGVIRAKTGEGRMQLWVLAFFPLAVVLMFNAIQDGYFEPLQETFVGQLAAGVAGALWIASLLVARKVLTVDI
jgi:tight adherence protein B